MGYVYGQYLTFLGDLLNHAPGRYTLPNGAVGGAASGSAALGTGSAPDGFAGGNSSGVNYSLKDVAVPNPKPSTINIVVRATKGGVQEKTDSVYEVELDSLGAQVNPRPNAAYVQSMSSTGLDLSVIAAVLNDNSAVQAAYIDLYVVAIGSPITLSSPDASVALSTPVFNRQSATLTFTVGGAGHYQVAVVSRSSAGARSANYIVEQRYITDAEPSSVLNLSAKVIRGRAQRV
jgi:hypothetical protein